MNFSQRTAFIPALVITAVIAGAMYWAKDAAIESTPYSYVNGHIVKMATEVDGKVARIHVNDHQLVKRGDLLFELDQTPFQIEVDKALAKYHGSKQASHQQQADVVTAQATVKQSEAEVENVKALLARMQNLAKKGHVAKQDLVIAKSNLKKAQATLDSAQAKLQIAQSAASDPSATHENMGAKEAALNNAQLNLSRAKIYAPTDGFIANLSIAEGEVIKAQQHLFSIINDSHLWVDAQFKESQLSNIQPGQAAHVRLVSHPSHTFQGVVESIASITTPGDQHASKWVTVKIRLKGDPAHPLRIGTTGKVDINTKMKVVQD